MNMNYERGKAINTACSLLSTSCCVMRTAAVSQSCMRAYLKLLYKQRMEGEIHKKHSKSKNL